MSRCADDQSQGAVLGVLQSTGAFARVCGPATGGLLYQSVGHEAPYFAAAIGIFVVVLLSTRLKARSADAGTARPAQADAAPS